MRRVCTKHNRIILPTEHAGSVLLQFAQSSLPKLRVRPDGNEGSFKTFSCVYFCLRGRNQLIGGIETMISQ